jgi:hypothetical protein
MKFVDLDGDALQVIREIIARNSNGITDKDKELLGATVADMYARYMRFMKLIAVKEKEGVKLEPLEIPHRLFTERCEFLCADQRLADMIKKAKPSNPLGAGDSSDTEGDAKVFKLVEQEKKSNQKASLSKLYALVNEKKLYSQEELKKDTEDKLHGATEKAYERFRKRLNFMKSRWEFMFEDEFLSPRK